MYKYEHAVGRRLTGVLSLAVIAATLASCGIDEYRSPKRSSAQDTYLALIEEIEAGASLEEMQRYTSKARNQKTEKRINEYMAERGANREAVVALMHSFLMRSEECRDRSLESETVSAEGKVTLIYTLTDICEDFGEFGKETVTMIQEDGAWKVDEIVSNESY